MAAGEVDCVVTGADRIAANGDTANKIGTYALAVLAAASRDPALRRRAELDVRPATPDGSCDPDRGARPGRDHDAVPRAQPGLRRDAGRADHGDRHRARRPPAAVCRSLHGAGGGVKAIVLAAGYATRLRPLTDTWAKELLAGRRQARSSTGSSTRSAASTTRRGPRRDERPQGARRSRVGRRSRTSRCTTTARRRTTTGSARSATSASCRAGAARRRPARDRRRQPLRLLASPTTSPSGARRAARVRSPSATSARWSSRRITGSSSSTTTAGSSTSSRSPPTRRRRSRRPRRTSSPARTCGCSVRISTAGTAPTSPAASSSGSAAASRCTAGCSTVRWYDIGDREQLLEADNRLRADAGAAGARRVHARLSGRTDRRTILFTEPGQTRARDPPYRRRRGSSISSSRRAASPAVAPADAALRRCRAVAAAGRRRRSARAVARRPPGRSSAAGSARGAVLAFASARAAVSTPGRRGPLVTAGRSAASAALARLAAELVVEQVRAPAADVITHVPPDGDRSSSAATTRPSGSRASSARRWELSCARLLVAARPSPTADGAPARPSGAGTSRGAFGAAATCRGASCSSTTSTRPARPRRRPPRHCAPRGATSWSTFVAPSRRACAVRLRRCRHGLTTTKEAANEASGEGQERGGHPADP